MDCHKFKDAKKVEVNINHIRTLIKRVKKLIDWLEGGTRHVADIGGKIEMNGRLEYVIESARLEERRFSCHDEAEYLKLYGDVVDSINKTAITELYHLLRKLYKAEGDLLNKFKEI